MLLSEIESDVAVPAWLAADMSATATPEKPPVQGQANHFVRYAPEKIEYGMKRYTNETKRLYQVMDTHLSDREWLAAGEYTIAGASQ